MILNNMKKLISKLENISGDIANYLAVQQNNDGTFPARDFYGKSFSALLWSTYGDQFRCNIDRAIKVITEEQKIRKGPGKYHFEFNRFALAKMGAVKGKLNTILQGEHYAGTRVANWILLRAWCRLTTGHILSRVIGQLELQAVLFWFRTKDGLIEDERGSFTLQYHAFCVALLGESEPYVWGFRRVSVHKNILKGADAMAELVLPGGQCNYMGRGSLQSFGYAAAILAFSHAYRISKNDKYLLLMQEITDYLSRYQRRDGSIPLVLSTIGREEGPPDEVDQTSASYAGWYTYNNFYDYLPFTGALIKLAQENLERLQGNTVKKLGRLVEESKTHVVGVTSLGSDIKIIRTKCYTAVVSTPNRVWASSQPMPYLAVGKINPLPCYGAEQNGPGLYSIADLPLPSFWAEGEGVQKNDNLYYCDPESYRWISENEMRGCWKGGEHHRSFIWNESSYEVIDRVTYKVKIDDLSSIHCNIIRIPLPERKIKKNDGGLLVVPPLHMVAEGDWQKEICEVYSPDGPLRVFFNTLVLIKGTEASAKHVVSVMEH